MKKANVTTPYSMENGSRKLRVLLLSLVLAFFCLSAPNALARNSGDEETPKERRSGLLGAEVAQSTRDGFIMGLPLFWAADENFDFTYTPVWRGKRGLSNTLEGRYNFENGRGIWQFTNLDDKEPRDFYYKNKTDKQEAEERYWLRAQNRWRFGELDVNLNLDMVSDPLYLAEFRDDLDGFNKSFNRQEFDHSFNEYLDPMRVNTLFAQRTGYDNFLRGTLEYTDDLYSKDNYDTIQRLPSLQYNMVGRPLLEGLESNLDRLPRFSLGVSYDYFSWRSNELSLTDETGHRLLLPPP